MTDERDALELLDALRGHLVAYPGDQKAREGIRRLAREGFAPKVHFTSDF